MRRILVALGLAVGALAAAPTFSGSIGWGAAYPGLGVSQDGSELEPLVRGEIAQAAEMDLGRLWTRALALRDLAQAHGWAGFDALLEELLREGAELGVNGLLLTAATDIQASDPHLDLLVAGLEPLIDRGDEAARAAVDLLGKPVFKRLDRERRSTLSLHLLTVGADAALEPEFRLRAARAAFELGNGEERRQARDLISEFLHSSDARLRAQGALSLAQIGEEVSATLQAELERLEDLPGPDGELARAYLEREKEKRFYEDRSRREVQFYEKKQLPEELRQISTVMSLVEQAHLDGDKFDREELTNAAIDGMLRALDEHSTYMEPDFYKKFSESIEAEYGGIGAYVGIDKDDGLFTITRPIYSGPAYKAGLMTDDKIVRIDEWPTIGETADDIIRRLKGKPGTNVKLYVWRRGMDTAMIERPTEDMAVVIERGQISIPETASQLLPGGVGLVELKNFSRVASDLMMEHIENMRAQGMKALVLDLRYNSGGLLTEAVDVADLFLPRGKEVVSTESRIERPSRLYTRSEPAIPEDMPVVVLVGRFTASASEIVSGALQDYGRAVLVGETTFGKGSVQTLEPVPGSRQDEFRDENGNRRYDSWEKITKDWDEDGEFDYAPVVKLTVARYRLPSGRSIHRELDRDRNVISEGGIEPDVEVRPDRIDLWRLQERYRIRDTRAVREYVDEHWQENAELLRQLAICDFKDPLLYPDFEAFLEDLDTKLPRDDVRSLIREEVRRRVQDEQGAEFPLGDFEEDHQVQRAVRVALEKLGVDVGTVPEYEATFDYEPLGTGGEPDTIAENLSLGKELENARGLLQTARDSDGRLSKEVLERVLTLLEKLEGQQAKVDR